MQTNENNKINTSKEQGISKQIENSLELLILYRSIYIIKQKFSLFKERIRNIYSKYNTYKGDLKLKTNNKIYQINIKNFAQVTDEVFQDLNLLLIKYSNPKDIFLSKVLVEKKKEETKYIIKEIVNWILNQNNNGNYSIKNYNINFFNKKIKPNLEQKIDYENFENMLDSKNTIINEDSHQNIENNEYIMLTEYNRRGKVINKYKSKKLEENSEVDEEGITKIIDIKNENKNYKNDKVIVNKELSININGLSNSKNNSKKLDSSGLIFIESLPLIIADFLQLHMNNAIVESEDELGRELNLLFDNEILKKMFEYKNIIKDKSSILDNIDNNVYESQEEENKKELENSMEEYKKVKENIDIYKGILETKKRSGENIDYIEKMIEKLLAKEIWLEHRIKLLMKKNKNNDKFGEISLNINGNHRSDNFIKINGNETNISELKNSFDKSKKISIDVNNLNYQKLNDSNSNILNSRIMNDKSISLLSSHTNLTSTKSNPKINYAIKEIFQYYSQIHLNVKKTRLFSYLEEKKLHLDLHEFSKFCSDFNIPIKRQKLVEIFKKSVSNLHLMTFKEFNNALISLADATHESNKKKLSEKIKHKKFELNSVILKEKQNKEEKKLKRLLYNNNADIKIDNGGKKTIQNRSSSGYAYRVDLKLEKKNIFNDITNNKIKYNKENKKSFQEIMNDFYEFLGLNNPRDYLSKIREYNISTTRSIDNLNSKKGSIKSISTGERTINRSRSFIELEIINIKKNERLQKELMEEQKMKDKLYKEKIKLFNINNQRLKITVDRKSKQKSYLELMKEKQEEKTEIISMHNHQKNILKNILKERELKKIKEREREKKLKNFMINNNISKDESKEQFQLNEISEIKKEKEEDYEKRNDKNQIWWSKLEKYNIEDLGMNEEEKELFINSELISDENYKKDNNDNNNDNNNKNNNDNNNINQNNNNNISFGALISDNSLIKSNSKGEIETNIGNKMDNIDIKNKNIKPIQLPLINSNKRNFQKEKETYKKNNSDILFKTNQNNKNNMIDAMKNRNNKI